MQKGLRIVPHISVAQAVKVARGVERWGYDSVWICDEGFTRDVYVTMTAIAGATERLRIGTGITNPYTRHVAVTAVAMATLNEYAGGRAFLGLGSGGSLVLDPMGRARTAQIATCREAIQVCRRLWAGERLTHDGEVIQLREAHMEVPPQSMEIWLAARGPKMLAMAAQEADGIWLDSLPKFAVADKVALIRQAAAVGGTSPRIALSIFVAPDRATLDAVRPYFTFAVVDSQPEVKERLGVTEQESAEIRRVMNTQGIFAAAPLVRDEVLQHFVFSGPPGDCLEEIRDLVRVHGIDQVILANDSDTPSFESTARIIAEL